MHVAFPFGIDARGRTAGASDSDHVRDLVEQVLFTTPGERVNRPSFGSGVLQLVFAPASDELTTATELLVQSALQQWLADLVEVQAVDVTADGSTVQVAVRYRLRRATVPQTVVFTRPV